MRSPVQSFPVKVQDVYANARASVPRSPRRKAWPMPLLSTLAAMAIGGGLGWYLTAEPFRSTEPGIGALSSFAEPHVSALLAGSGPGLELQGASDAPPLEVAARAWPIVLHRAGDGRFYADLKLDGHIVNILVDPGAPRSLLSAALLPPGAEPSPDGWLATEVILEHHRLPAIRFAVSDDPTVEAVLGADLLSRHFTIDEAFDRLRLAPRTNA